MVSYEPVTKARVSGGIEIVLSKSLFFDSKAEVMKYSNTSFTVEKVAVCSVIVVAPAIV